MQQQEMMDRLIEQYEGYFDIKQPFTHNGRAFLAYGHYHQYQEKYVLVRRAKMFGIETHEHVFFVYEDQLNQAAWQDLKRFIIEAEADFVHPNKEHMYSFMTLIVLCGKMDADVEADVKKTRYTKNYLYSIEGYSTVRVAAVDMSAETYCTNRQGRDLKKVLDRAMHA